ncbi:OLC1v1011987C1 [Oldenlandia corymbosa var. corymbosa]|uniref:Sulfotransferase n=1 Tax=Oldenlandia corymbosa var. corymbosa TaxID=529605 RepID=A0AAV1DV34_OLDCO|nr:OLC1v1011987C1 [Oldenlandia corymbosa var. corymbosa]
MAISPLSLATQSLPSIGGFGMKFDKHVRQEEGGEETLDDKLSFSGLVSLLPKERGWLSEHIHQYQGFWYSTGVLKGLLILQQHFQAQPSDILLASFPKSGTTWLKALIFTLTNPTCLDHPENPLLSANPHELVPMLEGYAAQHPDDPRPKLSSSSSLMHTHIPYVSLPESVKESGCRIVYVFRDPKDVLVSCWHFVNRLRPETVAPISLADAFQQFCRGASPYGSFWDHVLGYWKASIEWPKRVLFLRYEDLKKEPCVHTKRLAEFIGHPKTEESGGDEEERVRRVVEFCSFEKLSNLEVNKMGSHSGFGFPVIDNNIFFRKGTVGDSHNHLTKQMCDELDEITKDKFKDFV